MSNNGPRYQAKRGAGHECCYEAEVVDTAKPKSFRLADGSPSFEVVCECWDIETAIEIADALNSRAMVQ